MCQINIIRYYCCFNVFEVYQTSQINAKFHPEKQQKYGIYWHSEIKQNKLGQAQPELGFGENDLHFWFGLNGYGAKIGLNDPLDQ